MRVIPFMIAVSLIPFAADAGGLYDSIQAPVISLIPGDRNAVSHAVDAAGKQSGVRSSVDLAESVSTTKAYSYANTPVAAVAVGAAVFAGKAYRSKKGSFLVNNPLLGRHRITMSQHEATISEVQGLFGTTNSFGISNQTSGGPLKYTLGVSAHW